MKTNTTATVVKLGAATRPARGAYSARMLDEALCAGGAWAREARLVVALAAQAGVALDEDALLLADVRDLQRLRTCLLACAA